MNNKTCVIEDLSLVEIEEIEDKCSVAIGLAMDNDPRIKFSGWSSNLNEDGTISIYLESMHPQRIAYNIVLCNHEDLTLEIVTEKVKECWEQTMLELL
jgi:hypothetical protein